MIPSMLASVLLRVVLLLLLLPVAPARSGPGVRVTPSQGPPETWCGTREPRPGPLAAVRREAAAPPSCFACGAPASYRAFDGTTHALTRYTGRFVDLLLPATWIDGDGLDDAARRLLLDRADFVYQHATELMTGEPAGAGRLEIAVVPSTCGYGCGNIAMKGIEVVSSDAAKTELRSDLAAGVLPRILVHEMSHNFDLLGRDLWEGAPSTFDSHAWTTFFEKYLQTYTRMGSTTSSPDDVQKSATDSTWGAYVRDTAASWKRCIAEEACDAEGVSANTTWGGATHRFVQLHGPHAARRFLAALTSLRAAHGPSQSLQDRADLHFEAMAQGASADLGCYADAWRWSISAGLRARLASLPAEPRCSDADGDGVSPLLGDCDDADAGMAPGRTEIANGRDDDCNGLADDLLIVEPPGGSFSGAPLSLPGRAQGTLATGDSDDFWLDVPVEQDVAFEVCSRGFVGFFFVYDGIRWLGYQYTAQGECSRKSHRLGKGRWRVGFEAPNVSKTGAYTLAVGPGTHWPPTAEPVEEPQADACRLILDADSAPSGTIAAPDRTRFWVTGVGFVAEATHPGPGRAAYYPNAGVPGVLALREQPFEAEVPVGDWSGARSVSYAPAAGSACGADPDADGFVNGLDVCPGAPDPAQADADLDGTGDACDNCTVDQNGPLAPDAGGAWHRDTDGDGYGNVCDADLDGDRIVNFRDLARMKSVFFRSDANADLDGDGVVNFRDLARMKTRFFRAPGPSALAP